MSRTLLHWLRLPQRVDFKVAVMAFRLLHGLALPHLNDLVHVARQPVWSSPTSLIIITSTACSIIPAHNRWSTHISSRCISPLQLTAI